jgi:hypothetical protein
MWSNSSPRRCGALERSCRTRKWRQVTAPRRIWLSRAQRRRLLLLDGGEPCRAAAAAHARYIEAHSSAPKEADWPCVRFAREAARGDGLPHVSRKRNANRHHFVRLRFSDPAHCPSGRSCPVSLVRWIVPVMGRQPAHLSRLAAAPPCRRPWGMRRWAYASRTSGCPDSTLACHRDPSGACGCFSLGGPGASRARGSCRAWAAAAISRADCAVQPMLARAERRYAARSDHSATGTGRTRTPPYAAASSR